MAVLPVTKIKKLLFAIPVCLDFTLMVKISAFNALPLTLAAKNAIRITNVSIVCFLSIYITVNVWRALRNSFIVRTATATDAMNALNHISQTISAGVYYAAHTSLTVYSAILRLVAPNFNPPNTQSKTFAIYVTL